MRSKGIDDKMVFFCRRYSDSRFGSYFEYRHNKEVCNPEDRQRFYLKMGGIVYLPKKEVSGKRNWTSAERIKDSNYFGSYVYFGDTDKRLRVLLYARRKGLPQQKLVSQPGCVHNVIPRYHGLEPDVVITGMSITRNCKSRRRWTMYDSDKKGSHAGFVEIEHNTDITKLLSRDNDIFHQAAGRLGIYVPENTTLVLVDICAKHLYNDNCRQYVYTVFQSGAFVCTDLEQYFCFYDEEEGDQYDPNQLVAQKMNSLSETPNLEKINWKNVLNPDRMLDRVVFLKTAPNHTFWTLRVAYHYSFYYKVLQICIPTGGQFEDIMDWTDGTREVKRRQSAKPWNIYIERFKSREDKPLSEINMNVNEAYPGMIKDL